MIGKLNLKTVAVMALGLVLLGATLFELKAAGPGAGAATPAVGAHQARISAAGSIRAEGRVTTYPGGEVIVGTDFAGTISRLLVEEKSVVHKGDLLAEIRAEELRASLGEARGKVAESRADLQLFEIEANRLERLWQSRSVAQNAYDRAIRDREAAKGRLQTNAATVHRIEATLDKARILSPIDGVVLLRQVQPGETVAVGATLFTVADLSRVRVETEVDEFDLGKLTLGAQALVTAEGFPERSWVGRVEQIPDLVGPRKLKPQDPGKPSDTRVLLVKVALSEPTPLKLGQRVEVALRP